MNDVAVPVAPGSQSGLVDQIVARVRSTPDLLTETVERLLDRTVASALAQSLPVHSPDGAYERVVESWSAGRANPVGLVASWLAGRWATRTLQIGKRLSVPVSMVLTAVPPLALSFARGALELRVLASYVVNKLRDDGVTVDARFVQRLTVNMYCWSSLGPDAVKERPAAIARLATLWVTRAVASDEPGVRVRNAARSIAELDLRALQQRFAR